MAFGMRKPSFNKSFSARTKGQMTRAMKRAIIPGYGKKGRGILNPKKAMYNKVYRMTTVSAWDWNKFWGKEKPRSDDVAILNGTTGGMDSQKSVVTANNRNKSNNTPLFIAVIIIAIALIAATNAVLENYEPLSSDDISVNSAHLISQSTAEPKTELPPPLNSEPEYLAVVKAEPEETSDAESVEESDAGYEAGYAAGDAAGYAQGYQVGYNEGGGTGYDNGYAAGQKAGYEEGYAAGEAAGYKQGYKSGYDEGGGIGYDNGYAAGQKAVSKSGSGSSGSSSSSSKSSGGGGGRGNADNFNTYDNASQQNTSAKYVLNTSSMKIHKPSCSTVKKISPANYKTSNKTISELEAQGYKCCGICLK